jgi:hypothetical protein
VTQDHTLIFICGLHRSGTSLLHRLLRAHPAISGFSGTRSPGNEGQWLQTVFKGSAATGGAGKFCLNPLSHLTEDSLLVTPQNREKLWHEWSRHWDTKKSFLIEKSPPNLIRSRFLQAMFPNSKFIFLLRHPLAVSYATPNLVKTEAAKKKMRTRLRQLIAHWVRGHQYMLEDVPHLAHYTIVRYENLVVAPDKVLRHLHDFIGITPFPAAESVRPNVNAKYFAMWREDLKKRPELLKQVRTMRALINGFGYYFVQPYTRAIRISGV